MEGIPSLDLFNFNEPIAAESQYILTSPRSLEACARFGIKPVQLLPKSHVEFEDEYGPQSGNIAVLHKNFEKERLRKLRLCRQERKRIIDENANKESDDEYENDDDADADEVISNTNQKNVSAFYVIDSGLESRFFSNKNETATKKTRGKPSILSYLDDTSTYSPRTSTVTTHAHAHGKTSDYKGDYELKNLSDSEIAPDNHIQNGEEMLTKKRKCKIKRTHSFRTRKDLSLHDNVNTSPRNMKENLSLTSVQFSRIQSSVSCNSRKIEKQTREQHIALMNDITEKHTRAGEAFQQRMRLKDHQRELNKMKQQERKEIQEHQLQTMERNLQVWQEQLKEYQEASAVRASKVIEIRNSLTSQKTHEKRYRREMDHTTMKLKIEEEERLRQQQLKTLITLKDERSKLINNEKEEYAKIGRDAARLTRSIKQRIKEETINNSFDKMAAHGERMARLEQVSAKKSQSSSTIHIKPTKNRSILTLG